MNETDKEPQAPPVHEQWMAEVMHLVSELADDVRSDRDTKDTEEAIRARLLLGLKLDPAAAAWGLLWEREHQGNKYLRKLLDETLEDLRNVDRKIRGVAW